MRHSSILAIIGLLAVVACASPPADARDPHALTLASPQPDAAALKPGLAVKYAYPRDIEWLADARRALRGDAKPGQPLVGFDYVDSHLGEKVLTSDRDENVAAHIEGYMRFDKPGTYQLGFQSNDGLEVELGGQEVYKHDGRHTCETNGWEAVAVPEAGWYLLSATFFQRLNTACLLLEWTTPDGAKAWVPNEAFAHLPQ